MSNPEYKKLICTSNRRDRTVTFNIREDFGDGKDHNGLVLAHSGYEREFYVKIFNDALDHILSNEPRDEVDQWYEL